MPKCFVDTAMYRAGGWSGGDGNLCVTMVFLDFSRAQPRAKLGRRGAGMRKRTTKEEAAGGGRKKK